MKKRNGMTIIEVVVAFVIMSFVGSMVAGVVTGTYALSAKLKTLPNAYYNVQGSLEKDLKVLKGVAEAHRDYRDAIEEGEATAESAKEKYDELLESEAVKELGEAATNPRERMLFNKKVFVYSLNREVEGNNVKFVLVGGVSAAGKAKRPLPVITNVTIRGYNQVENNKEKFAFPYGNNKVVYGRPIQAIQNNPKKQIPVKILQAEAPDPGAILKGRKDADKARRAEYAEKDVEYLWDEYYQWYMSTGKKHSTPVDSELSSDIIEKNYAEISPTYPSGYTPIPGETKNYIDELEKYQGKFLVLVVTPLSGSGMTGQPFASNPIYVSSLPQLSRQAKYAFLADPSMEEIRVESAQISGDVGPDMMPWTAEGTGDFSNDHPKGNIPKLNLSGDVKLSIKGAVTGTAGQSASSEPDEAVSRSRFYEFSPGSYAEVRLNDKKSEYEVFVVVNAAKEELLGQVGDDFYTTGFVESKNDGDYQQAEVVTVSHPSNEGWRILHCKLQHQHSTIKLGDMASKAAEMIVVRGIDDDKPGDRDSIFTYLSEKYVIETDWEDIKIVNDDEDNDDD